MTASDSILLASGAAAIGGFLNHLGGFLSSPGAGVLVGFVVSGVAFGLFLKQVCRHCKPED